MTIQKALNKVAQKEQFVDFNDALFYYTYRDVDNGRILDIIAKAMQLYAQQFIDCANKTIEPATAILPDTYNEDLFDWYDLIKINKVK